MNKLCLLGANFNIRYFLKLLKTNTYYILYHNETHTFSLCSNKYQCSTLWKFWGKISPSAAQLFPTYINNNAKQDRLYLHVFPRSQYSFCFRCPFFYPEYVSEGYGLEWMSFQKTDSIHTPSCAIVKICKFVKYISIIVN